ncbi:MULTISPECIES: Hpt domain-containing protein [Legionella]|uniref:Sensory box histidine kinase/response regulator n=1 Tax=Legionella maceachernii TaxID=466 RepID=A0A0W0WFP8_9GAMM|nr:Hpt domain-containing protein [Legionella maceachernii]KTD31136.1 sensory box histidine kinase/response regulator [Legionella maceachernii]SJZ99544.1 Hpt domain-containing protein [Legionella maceachernii]SUP01263.1 hybrid sensory histidine kinase BarA [Legionella maceachernii]
MNELKQVSPKENTTLANEKNKSLGIDLPNNEEELFLLDHYPLLDIELGLANLGDASILHELLELLLKKELPTELSEIEAAYTEHNWCKIEELAHKLKSAALYCGTVRLKLACQYLERYQKAGYTNLLDKLYFQLIQVANETEQSINDWISTHTA